MPALMAQRQRSSAMRNEIRRELERRRKAISIANGRVTKKSSAAQPPTRPFRSVAGAAAGATLKLGNGNGNAQREGLAKKCPAAPPLHPRVLIPSGAPGADTKKIAYLDLGEAPRRCTAPRRREALIPSTMKAAKSAAAPTAFIPHASAAAATKLSLSATRAEAEYVKKPSSTPIQQPGSWVKKGMTVKVRVPAGTHLPTGQRIVILHPAVVISDVEDGYIEVIYKGNYPRVPTVRVALDQVVKWNLPGDHR